MMEKCSTLEQLYAKIDMINILNTITYKFLIKMHILLEKIFKYIWQIKTIKKKSKKGAKYFSPSFKKKLFHNAT